MALPLEAIIKNEKLFVEQVVLVAAHSAYATSYHFTAVGTGLYSSLTGRGRKGYTSLGCGGLGCVSGGCRSGGAVYATIVRALIMRCDNGAVINQLAEGINTDRRNPRDKGAYSDNEQSEQKTKRLNHEYTQYYRKSDTNVSNETCDVF